MECNFSYEEETYEKEDAFFAFGKWDPNDTQNESDQDGHRGRQGHVEYNFVREVGYNGQKRCMADESPKEDC